ncbi:MAG: GxxExxY protein [Gemmatimonadota bacterium]|nr:GxxExxY protein [Gemmatimonadota bacterium]
MAEEALTRQVIGCFFTAYNELTFGLLESVHSAALAMLFRDVGLDARREHSVDVMFRDTKVGTFRVDYFLEDTLILELKAGHQLPMGSRAQLLTYLRISRKALSLLLFFGPSPEVERVVLG